MKRAIAKIALGTFLSFTGLCFAGYYGGGLKNHGHTSAAGDGGPLTNPIITGTITPSKVNTSTITAQQVTVTTLIMPSSGTATLGQVTNLNGGPVGMFVNKVPNGTFFLDTKYNRTSHTITVASSRDWLADNWTGQCSNTGAGAYNLQTFSVNLSSYPFTTYGQATVNGACDVTGGNRLGEIRGTIDGKNTQDFMFGTSSAASVTLSFYVLNDYSGGRQGGSLCNGSQTRCYAFDYPSTSTGVWVRNTITIPGDTGGSWTAADSTMTVRFDLGSGTTYVVGSSSWAASSANHLSGDVVYCDGGGGSVFKISGVQLEKSSTTTVYESHPPTLDSLLMPRTNTFQETTVGAFGEYYSSATPSGVFVNISTTPAGFQNVLSLTVPPGTWNLTANVATGLTSGAVTRAQWVVSTGTGTLALDQVQGLNLTETGIPSAVFNCYSTINQYLVTVLTTTTYYLKALIAATVSPQSGLGILTAERKTRP